MVEINPCKKQKNEKDKRETYLCGWKSYNLPSFPQILVSSSSLIFPERYSSIFANGSSVCRKRCSAMLERYIGWETTLKKGKWKVSKTTAFVWSSWLCIGGAQLLFLWLQQKFQWASWSFCYGQNLKMRMQDKWLFHLKNLAFNPSPNSLYLQLQLSP